MKLWLKSTLVFFSLVALVWSCKDGDSIWDTLVPETDENPTASQIQTFVFKPALAPATDANVQQLRVPAGFVVSKFAEDLGKPRMVTISSAGHVYFTDRDAGTVTMLRDTDADGVADTKQIVANIRQAHDTKIQNGRMYIVAVTELYVADMNADGTLAQPQMLINNLPDGGQHPNRTLAFGPDGKMYVSIGSTCNSCPEPNEEHATMLRFNADGTGREIFAKGLRNTIGFGWHPITQEMWGMDHGIDNLGDDEEKEELNKLVQNADYGWPYIYSTGNYNPYDRPEDMTYAQYLATTTLPTLTYTAHAAPMGMVFYTGTQFPADYQGDAFIAMRGSWNRSTPSGYNVVRLHFENGQPVRFEEFLTGFLVNNNRSHFGRLVGLAMHPDGSLLVSDDTNGVIYRIAAVGQ